ncbi:MAG: hypothetical protein ABI488_12535 [Polyangiaceae bacterium]
MRKKIAFLLTARDAQLFDFVAARSHGAVQARPVNGGEQRLAHVVGDETSARRSTRLFAQHQPLRVGHDAERERDGGQRFVQQL